MLLGQLGQHLQRPLSYRAVRQLLLVASYTTTAAAPGPDVPPVLDLCNQVQSIWLPQGALDYMGRWWGGSNPESCTKEATLG